MSIRKQPFNAVIMDKIKLCLAVTFLVAFSSPLFSGWGIGSEELEFAGKHGYLPNIAVVRFDTDDKESADAVLAKYDAKIIERAMPIQSSYRYNPSLLNRDAVLKSNSGLKNAFDAEDVLLRTFIVKTQKGKFAKELIRNLHKYEPSVEIAEPKYVSRILEKKIPNDPLYIQQQQLETIKALDGWSIHDGSEDIVICVSDNGIDNRHVDLEPNIAVNSAEIRDNDIDDDNNGYIDDYMGYNFGHEDDGTPWGDTYVQDDHGTNVSGIASSAYNNSLGVAGIGGKCRFFPIKGGLINNPEFVVYDFPSIVYAASRGFHIFNASWGDDNPYSHYEQSVIDFAVSRGMLVVAAAGNLGTGNNQSTTFYPGGYRGVLSVGETDHFDEFLGGILSENVKILAPGPDCFTTDLNQGYSYTSFGTSFSAPVVAGAAGVIKSKYPLLDPLQLLEFTRQTADDINSVNDIYDGALPGRVNLLKALETDPFSIPGIVPFEYVYKDSAGKVRDRFDVGEKIYLNIKARNVLGSFGKLNFKISVVWDLTNSSIIMVDSTSEIETVPAGAELEIGEFVFRVADYNSTKVIIKLDITGDGYSDLIKFSFVPYKRTKRFENNRIRFDISDVGSFGYYLLNGERDGIGFSLKGYDNHLWNAGIMVTDGDSKAYNALSSSGNPFKVIKKYIKPNENISIIGDDNALPENKIGIEIKQTVSFPGEDLSAAKIEIELTNISGEDLAIHSIGYNFDWDVFSSKFNETGLLPDAIPAGMAGINAAAEYIKHIDSSLAYGIAVYSSEVGAVAQAAGLSHSDADIDIEEDMIKVLSDGTSWQSDEIGDKNITAGMQYVGKTAPGSTRKCTLCIGVGETIDDLAFALKACLDPAVGISENRIKIEELKLFPNPVLKELIIESNHFLNDEVTITDINGREVIKIELGNFQDNIIINTSGLQSGMYFVRIGIYKGKFIKLAN